MAKVTIVIEDEEGGVVDVKMEFDPPAQPGENPTPAQTAALKALTAMQDSSDEWDEIMDDDWEDSNDSEV